VWTPRDDSLVFIVFRQFKTNAYLSVYLPYRQPLSLKNENVKGRNIQVIRGLITTR